MFNADFVGIQVHYNLLCDNEVLLTGMHFELHWPSIHTSDDEHTPQLDLIPHSSITKPHLAPVFAQVVFYIHEKVIVSRPFHSRRSSKWNILTPTQVHLPFMHESGDSHMPQLIWTPQSLIRPPQVTPAVSQVTFCKTNLSMHTCLDDTFHRINKVVVIARILTGTQVHCPCKQVSVDVQTPHLIFIPQSSVMFPQVIPAVAEVIFCGKVETTHHKLLKTGAARSSIS